MITQKIDNFSLQQIADSGQCFRMNRLDSGFFSVISGGHYLELSQSDGQFTFLCSEEDMPFWQNYFDLDTDYGGFISSIRSEDPYLMNAAKAGSGIRILRQNPWEMIITFILSQQKTIPKIKEAVEALCRSYGTETTIRFNSGEKNREAVSRTFHTFPDAGQLSKASLADLQNAKLGYRAKYIERITADCVKGLLDLNRLNHLTYREAVDYLTGFYGIGIKVANCICLFGLHHIDAFPVDTWIEQILENHYFDDKYRVLPKSKQYSSVISDHFGCYEGYAGVMQQYLFYYERLALDKIR